MLSHELRTPLNAILGWSQMLKAGVMPPGGIPQAIAVIERNAQAQLRLVEDLLDVSRIVAGRFVLEKQRVDIAAVIGSAMESIRPALLEKQIAGVIDPPVALHSIYVYGDPDRLQQAVWNLLSNAAKFTPAGGRIRVEVRARDPFVDIAVCDNGEGISAAALPLIFERLQQGDNGTARRHGGLGLGLAIVRQIIELHQGTVSAESAGPGRGSTFHINLPAMTPSASPDHMIAQTIATPLVQRDPGVRALQGIRILLVEDTDDAREMITRVLTGEGAVIAAHDRAMPALEWLSANSADIIVSDIGMPGIDGWEMLKRVRSNTLMRAEVLPAIALTAHASQSDRDRSTAAGFQAHLAKPVDFNELVQTIAELCRKA